MGKGGRKDFLSQGKCKVSDILSGVQEKDLSTLQSDIQQALMSTSLKSIIV